MKVGPVLGVKGAFMKTSAQKLFSKFQSRVQASVGIGLCALALTTAGCNKQPGSFSLLSDGNSFKQNDVEINGKIDVLWVVDNSGSMQTSQENVAKNFSSFISKFKDKGYDFRIAVITSDAYRVAPYVGASADRAKFRDGANGKNSGVFVINPDTPNLEQTFITNIMQGIYGSGDERAFSSIEWALDSTQNAPYIPSDFLREGAFLAVIIVSDEDDFSYDGGSLNENYSDTRMHKVQRYVEYLDQKMKVVDGARSSKYNVNAISILDDSCRLQLDPGGNGAQKIGRRYIELADATGGVKGSLCSDFGSTLADISSKIIQLRSKFYLGGEPNPETIRVIVNGQEIPRVVPGVQEGGFIYDSSDNSIMFVGDGYTPGPGANIQVSFDPKGLR